MRILVTGCNGFVGRNLVENLKNIRDGKNRTRPELMITEIYEYDIDSDVAVFEEACRKADFVFHFAGVNRPEEISAFMMGNLEPAKNLLNTLRKYNNMCPVMFSSSIQAFLAGRFENSEYGRSKRAGEEMFFRYSAETGAKVLVYRFPNLFGKWCRPNYNSVVATFCNAVANDLDYTMNDSGTMLELLYIDDLVNEMLDALEGKEHRCKYRMDNSHSGLEPEPAEEGPYCYVPTTYTVALGEIVDLLKSFKVMPVTLTIPFIYDNSFAKKLYSTYLSYLPEEAISYNLNMNVDNRGIFTELFKIGSYGQVSINITRPGITRGQHWHNSKWEIFMVVNGHGLIQERRLGINPDTGAEYPVFSFEVTGEQMKAVQVLPGYAHSISNLSKTDNLVTVIWANEPFNSKYPDTFYEQVCKPDKQAQEITGGHNE